MRASDLDAAKHRALTRNQPLDFSPLERAAYELGVRVMEYEVARLMLKESNSRADWHSNQVRDLSEIVGEDGDADC